MFEYNVQIEITLSAFVSNVLCSTLLPKPLSKYFLPLSYFRIFTPDRSSNSSRRNLQRQKKHLKTDWFWGDDCNFVSKMWRDGWLPCQPPSFYTALYHCSATTSIFAAFTIHFMLKIELKIPKFSIKCWLNEILWHSDKYFILLPPFNRTFGQIDRILFINIWKHSRHLSQYQYQCNLLQQEHNWDILQNKLVAHGEFQELIYLCSDPVFWSWSSIL